MIHIVVGITEWWSPGDTFNDIYSFYSFEYLGARLQCDGADDADVIHRMAIAQQHSDPCPTSGTITACRTP